MSRWWPGADDRLLRGEAGPCRWTWLTMRMLACVCVCAGMVGCRSTLPDAPGPTGAPRGAASGTPADWSVQQRYAAAALPFELLGKVAMPSGSANIRWQQRGERFELRLWGPFGAGAAIIRGDASAIRFERDGVERAGDPLQILSDELGWSVPVDALSFWVRGLPAPAQDTISLELRDGRLAHMRQAGWSIDIDRYQRQADGGWLPARLTARQADVRFTLVVQSWVYGAAMPATSAVEPASASASP